MSLRLRSQDVRETSRRSFIIRLCEYIAGALLIAFVIISIVSANMKINDYQKEYDELVAQTNAVRDTNAKISRYLNDEADMDEYIEAIARDKLDFAKPDEKVYYIVPDPGSE